jgi:hypothetical protein
VYAETERAGLCEFLDMQREARIAKLRGVSDEDARRSPTVSSLSEQIAASQEILLTVDLDARCAWPEMAGNLRWVAVHMIEETARHAGHADIIRETIDVGRG